MRRTSIFLVAIILSCNHQNTDKETASHEIKLERELYSKILDYQSKYSIPPNNIKKDLYVYDVTFYRRNQDTLVGITRSPAGIAGSPNQILFGVYQTDSMFPTIIRDASELYSRNYVKKFVQDTMELLKYKPNPKKNYSENFPPVFKYKVTGKRLTLFEIDTIWSTW